MTVLSYALSLTNGAFLGPMRTAQGALSGFTQQLSKVGNIVTGLANMPAVINTLVEPLKQPITLAAGMESLNEEMRILIGDAPRAAAMLKDIKAFADVTPFQMQGLVENAKTLLGFGSSVDSVMPSLKMLGDVAGSSSDRMERLTLAYAQITASGKLMGQDLLQLINAGFNPLQEISRTTGQSMGSLREQMEKGAISSEMVAGAFRSATSAGGRFFGNTAAQGKTFNGVISTMGDSLKDLQRAFGEPTMQALKPIIKDLTGISQELNPIAANFGKTLATGISGAFALFKSGDLGNVLKTSMAGIGSALFQNFGVGLNAAIRTGAEVLKGGFQSAVGLFSDASLWEGIRGSALSIAYSVKSIILGVAADLVSMLPGKDGVAAEWKKTAQSTQGLADAYQQNAAANFDNVDFDKVIQPLVDSAGSAGGILGDAITQIATNLKNNTAISEVAESLRNAAAAGLTAQSQMTSLAEQMRQASSGDMFLSGTSRRESRQTPDGVFQQMNQLLNPQAIERLLNPSQGGGKEKDALKKAIEDASPLKELIRSVQRVVEGIENINLGSYPVS